MTGIDGAPNKRLVIKLRLPSSQKRDNPPSKAPDSSGLKRRQCQCSIEHSEVGKCYHNIEEVAMKENIVELKKKIVPMVQKMDRAKKMNCWVILKRFMVGRDGWALKEPLDHKGLDVLGNPKCKSESLDLRKVKPIGMKEIESKLNNLLYSRTNEFADDMRLMFSCAMSYPTRSEIHIIGRRLSESFELSWRTLKDKWAKEARKEKKRLIRQQMLGEGNEGRAAREVAKHSQCDDADNSQWRDNNILIPRRKRSRTNDR